MAAYVTEWGSLLLRWLHIVTAMAWIGASFFFMHLDASLRTTPTIAKGGVAWEVHGGGFYEMRKYLVAPEQMPPELTWHKWQSYWTWISGFSLMVWIYYGQSSLYLVNPEVMRLAPFEAVLLGVGGLALGWVVYDQACRRLVGRHDALLAGLVFVFVIGMSWAWAHVFSGRGAMIHTGALMATMMTGNVFLNIIPNQKKVVADLLAGRTPNPAFGHQAKQRSTHNNYFTLPVIFMMISNHYPTTFADNAVIPLVVTLVIVAGAVVRHFFNIRHRLHGDNWRSPWWAWAVAALALFTAFYAGMAASPSGRDRLGLPPLAAPEPGKAAAATEPAAMPLRLADALPPPAVVEVISTRCAMCHAAQPAFEGLQIAPKNVHLDTPAAIARQADAIRVQAVLSHAMPPNNLSEMTPEERSVLAAWLLPRT
ncbi:urate hydroxylase PuuD [Lichenihabitans sp. Uapishka_5]|uniref:urate hydroxylase PuuD n=1 Tax=Lichenihabitans sp. Uapishka_5 TaxID=3037302 RepID=UPI0029E7CFBC|nr:urate hydroxylase PuuD [Lichenihabitans sp. Uapishka_5]MDX7953640.1 urate hydroxylase PuuD [Lichenihabitans sp. Uapishka_5]